MLHFDRFSFLVSLLFRAGGVSVFFLPQLVFIIISNVYIGVSDYQLYFVIG